ncbi:hypothetical protein, partial [Leptospira weilii]|uniref:hypothetical protein n=2 Tax=Leptospira weilii TaxID=28184 RepID=UPI001C40103A
SGIGVGKMKIQNSGLKSEDEHPSIPILKEFFTARIHLFLDSDLGFEILVHNLAVETKSVMNPWID